MIEDTPDGALPRPAKSFKPTRPEDVVGCTGYKGPAKTLEEMEDAIANGVKALRSEEMSDLTRVRRRMR